MNVLQTEKPQKKISFYLSIAFMSGILMYVMQYFVVDLLLYSLLSAFGEGWARVEWLWLLAVSCTYLLTLGVAGALVLVAFRKSPLSGFTGTPGCPRLPFLFIPVTIGSLYLLNLIVNLAFGDLLAPFESNYTVDSFPHSPLGVAAYLVYLAVIPGIFEEWFFRGVLQKNLATVISRKSAIVISALIFGFMHVDPGQTVFAFGFGLIAGYLFDKTGSIWFGVLIHLLNNAISGCGTYWTYVYQSESVMMAFSISTLVMIGIAVIGFPIFLATAGKRKVVRLGEAERMLPAGRSVLKVTLKNPFTYLMFAGYCCLIWLVYFR